jgi:hypothetical protein
MFVKKIDLFKNYLLDDLKLEQKMNISAESSRLAPGLTILTCAKSLSNSV